MLYVVVSRVALGWMSLYWSLTGGEYVYVVYENTLGRAFSCLLVLVLVKV